MFLTFPCSNATPDSNEWVTGLTHYALSTHLCPSTILPPPLHPTASAGFVAEQFLHSTATQLTYHGLCELTSTVQEGELGVFFRNNHFSTMSKYKVT